LNEATSTASAAAANTSAAKIRTSAASTYFTTRPWAASVYVPCAVLFELEPGQPFETYARVELGQRQLQKD
jgi:hypothetical protein